MTGVVSNDLVTRWGAGGYVGRASGRDFDARRDLAYPPYASMTFRVPVLATGDVDARMRVRLTKVETSMMLRRTCFRAVRTGPVRIALPVIAEVREGVAVTEAFRGDLLVWLRIGAQRITRCHLRDASWFQWPLLEAAIEEIGRAS